MTSLEARYARAIETNNLGLRARLRVELDELDQFDDMVATPKTMLHAAEAYALRGIAVFPCTPRGKAPIAAHGFKDATISLEQLQRWWDATPDANIGTPTGHLFDVIDIDGPDGIEATRGMTFPPIIAKVLTPRTAGMHWFIAPTGRGNGASIFPSVDYRGAGGYVLLPPSVGSNGARYRWAQEMETT